jgi:hypothetical protein
VREHAGVTRRLSLARTLRRSRLSQPSQIRPAQPLVTLRRACAPHTTTQAVRRVDDEALLFFAGVTWGDFGPGFTAAPGGDDYANRSVLAYHYYHPPQLGTTEDVVAQLAAARRLSTGIFLTETCGGKTHNVTLAQAADAHLQSSAYWEYSTSQTPPTRAPMPAASSVCRL